MNYHQVKTRYLQAALLCKSGYYYKARQSLKQVVILSKEYKNLHLDAGLALAGVFKKLSKYEYSIKMLKYLIETFRNDFSLQSILCLDLATAKHINGDPIGAKSDAEKACEFDSAIFNPMQSWYWLMVKGRYLSLCGKQNEAIKYKERAWPICQEAKMEYRMMQVATNIGNVLFLIGDYDEGGKLAQKALIMACHIGAQYWAARNCLALMQLAFRKGDILDAKEYGKRCFRLAYRNGYRDILEEASQSTGDYYSAIGDGEVAEVFYKKAVSVRSETPAKVLEKIDRIYDTAYSQRKLNIKFNSSGNKWVLDRANDSTLRRVQTATILKYRYIFGSLKTKPKKTPKTDGNA